MGGTFDLWEAPEMGDWALEYALAAGSLPPSPPGKAKLDGSGILLAFLTAEEWLLETVGLREG